jgi:serine/threonine protein phosphatase 1
MTERIIAVGDIHGCSLALDTVIGAIRPTAQDTLIFLGDYVDRGPDSRGVLERVMKLSETCTVVPLLGNHEEMLLRALDGRAEFEFWLKFGGTACLASYDLRGAFYHPSFMPKEHLEFIRCCRDYYETVSHFFVHAYYDPEPPLHLQKWEALRWASLPPNPIRHSSGKIAIVGHTAQRNGEILDLGCVQCIDTYCHGGGWLTALDVVSGQRWQARATGHLR